MPELAEGESDDEVGYNLEEWEDPARGELIEALIEHEFRHRFEGDELVVAADDEDDIDDLIARPRAPAAPKARPTTLGPGEVLTELNDACRRLEVDPTDMDADGDLAEAAAGVFAIDVVWGVDDETWAAIGRVTRRLLGALGAEEALEEEIAANAALLCTDAGRPRRQGPRASARPLPRPLRRGPTPLPTPLPMAGGEGEGVAGDDEGAEEASGQEDEVVYELEDWRPEERAQISLLLERGQSLPLGGQRPGRRHRP